MAKAMRAKDRLARLGYELRHHSAESTAARSRVYAEHRETGEVVEAESGTCIPDIKLAIELAQRNHCTLEAAGVSNEIIRLFDSRGYTLSISGNLLCVYREDPFEWRTEACDSGAWLDAVRLSALVRRRSVAELTTF
jgi:hypothetical protein